MKIGYARLANSDQLIETQKNALKAAGCKKIFVDVASGKKSFRPELENALHSLQAGDTFIVSNLDRLGRSIHELIQIMLYLHDKKVHFFCLQNNLYSCKDQNFFQVFYSLAEYEQNLLMERTDKGLKAARARGRCGGRPARLEFSQINQMIEIYVRGDTTVGSICKLFNISRPSFYNYLKTHTQKLNSSK